MGGPLVVAGDGTQTRDFIHVSDVVQLIERLVELRGSTGPFNAGTGSPTRVIELAQWIQATVNPHARIVHVARRSIDVDQSWASIEKARALGFSPRVRLQDWLQTLSPLSESRR
jgi:UDP-glucose 4-epimerase